MTLLITEQVNPETVGIDEVSTLELVRLINQQDQRVAAAVADELPRIAAAIDAIVERWQQGGRLFYVGTGTSGRLGVLDAVECPPTFGISPDRVQAIIAGGYEACWRAVEVAEDDPDAGAQSIIERGVTAQDAVVGIAASGRTPFTIGALTQARALGALTIGLACNPEPELATVVHICITPVVGPEVIAGSTRMKAGTAQKMVLNMLSTGVMIRLGYTYDNLMANLQLKNEKLRQRACGILQAQFGMSKQEAIELLSSAQWDLKVAFVMRQAQVTADHARDALAKSNHSIKRALALLNRVDKP
ncbi:MAG: N-acetylmuramic acid 6-phosphate etherase [Acidobacteriota bacterium]|nr:N-acetylmuramic acid 6-phosphate etherase [Blastocatellia bacterium]MDW8239555.1 N-acetylmuramic acid 6-phosphate etherase [Acidobacteriota bacterium]